jgi:hypothetical protein
MKRHASLSVEQLEGRSTPAVFLGVFLPPGVTQGIPIEQFIPPTVQMHGEFPVFLPPGVQAIATGNPDTLPPPVQMHGGFPVFRPPGISQDIIKDR